MIPELADRIVGCLVAGALGDAAGGPFEGRRGPFEVRWPDSIAASDDTQLTLATCEAIVAHRSVDPASIAAMFVEWHRARRITGVGSSVLKALVELEAGGHWAVSGAVGERAAGNGTAMRSAPLAFCLDPTDETGRRTIRDVSRITHRHDEAYVGALAIVYAVHSAAAFDALAHGPPTLNRPPPALLSFVTSRLPDSLVRDRLRVIQRDGLSVAECIQRFGASGYVVDSVPLAILAAQRGLDERRPLLDTFVELIHAGGDSDTICSMAGQIIGAARGTTCLPNELLGRFKNLSDVENRTRAFALWAGGRT